MSQVYRRCLTPLFSGLIVVAAGQCYAQQNPAGNTEVDEIIVTGSYIKGSPLDAPSPVQVIDRNAIESQGAASVWDVVKNLEINSGSTTNIGSTNEDGGVDGGIEGTANINLRNLGQNATLTLINGKRQVSAATTTRGGAEFVDINAIPTTMVERIEILSDGGSALYGSDAVAGVVNLIMRTDFVGTEIRGDLQQVQGAGSTYDATFSGVWGIDSNGGNTHFVLAGEYFERDPVPVTEGSFYDENSEFTGSVSGDGTFTPFNQVDFGANFNPAWINGPLTAENNANRVAAGLAPAAARYTDPLCGDPSVGFETFTGTRGDNPTDLSGNCREDTTRFRNIVNAEERHNAIASFKHAFSDAAELYSFVQYSQNEIQRLDEGTAQSLGPQFQLAAPGSYAGFGETMALGSQADFAGNTQPVITNAPNSLANGGPNVAAILSSPINLPRTAGDDNVTESRTAGAQLGVRGDFTFAGRNMNYDISYSHSSNDFEQDIRVVQRSRMELAINGLGGPNCVPNGVDNFPYNSSFTALSFIDGAVFQEFFPGFHLHTRETLSLALTSSNQGIGGCEFFNPFLTRLTDPDLANSPELLDWLTPVVKHVDGRNTLGVFDAVVAGDVMDLPAGPLQFAFGFQYRDQENRSKAPFINEPGRLVTGGYDESGAPILTYSSDNLRCSLCITTYDNTRNVRAWFGELSIPLADTIETQTALRYEDYGGGIGAELSPKFAISWRPIESLLLRTSYSQAFRAPNVGIVFQGFAASSNRGQDILSAQEVRAGILPPTVENAESEQVFTLGRPTPDLGNETAQTYNIGFQWTPTGGVLDGLRVQADFWRVELEDKVVPQPVVDALRPELELFVAASADPGNYVINSTLEPGETLTACDPNNLPEDPDNPGMTLPRVECVVNPAAYQVVGVQRALDGNGNLITAVIGAINAGEIVTDGVDVKLGYRWDTDYGIFNAGLDYTYVHQYELIDVPGLEEGLQGTGILDAAGTTGDGVTVRSLPDHKATLSLGWNYDRHSVTAISRYIGSYEDLLAPGVRADSSPQIAALSDDTIDSYNSWDFQYSYAADLFDNPAIFTVGVLDAFEADLPYRETAGGFNYDTEVFDPRGRRVYARALLQFQ